MNITKLLATSATALILTFSVPSLADNHGGDRTEMKAKFEQSLQQFPENKRDLVRSTFKEMREAHEARKGEKGDKGERGDKDARKADKEAMMKLLTASSFDKNAFMAQAKATSEAKQQDKLQNAERIANLAEQLNQEERKILADMLPKKKGKKGGKKGKKNQE